MGEKKRVRMLLRVSSNQQLEEDGDLGIQRQLVKEFIAQHEEWHLDSKEYFGASKEIPVTDLPTSFLPTWTSFNSLLRFVV